LLLYDPTDVQELTEIHDTVLSWFKVEPGLMALGVLSLRSHRARRTRRQVPPRPD
jgi:hypothetical protein